MPSHQPNPVSLLCFKSFQPSYSSFSKLKSHHFGEGFLKTTSRPENVQNIKVPRNMTPHFPQASHKLLISFPCTSRVKLIGRVPHLRVMDSGERITAPATNPLASFRKMREKMPLDGQKDPQKCTCQNTPARQDPQYRIQD